MKMVKIEGIEIPLETLEKAIADAKKEEYPKCFKAINTPAPFVALFDSLTSGVLLTRCGCIQVGEREESWVRHTDTDHWKEIPYDKERGFFDGQVVYCWENSWKSTTFMARYDVASESINLSNGSLSRYDNYSAELPKHIADLM